jgi:hypothetical protein
VSGSFLGRLEKVVEPAAVPELPPAAPEAVEEAAEAAEDAASEREIDEAVARTDESADRTAPSPASVPCEPREPAAAVPIAASGAPVPTGTELKALFSRLRVRPAEGGGISIEAPPEAASTLAALFEGMAKMLQGAAGG